MRAGPIFVSSAMYKEQTFSIRHPKLSHLKCPELRNRIKSTALCKSQARLAHHLHMDHTRRVLHGSTATARIIPVGIFCSCKQIVNRERKLHSLHEPPRKQEVERYHSVESSLKCLGCRAMPTYRGIAGMRVPFSSTKWPPALRTQQWCRDIRACRAVVGLSFPF